MASYGERALKEVAVMLKASMERRAKLRKAGWKRVKHPPLVNNQMVWESPAWGFHLEDQAVKLMEVDEELKSMGIPYPRDKQ